MKFDPYTAARVRRRVRRGGLSREWALRRLFRAGDHGDPFATDVAWELWLAHPDDRLWAALNRWRRPHSHGGQSLVALGEPAEPADVAAAACRTGHPVMTVARAAILAGHQDLVDAVCAAAMTDDELAAFCREHHLAPADPHRAAAYFLLTGQTEQYRLTDPDHSLLAIVYQGADDDERAAIRVAGATEPELVRALAGTVTRGRLTRLAEREADYLVDAFAGRQDWPGLWELAKNLPVFDAAAAVRRFDGWRPDGADAALFDLLAATKPDALAASYWAAATPGRVRIRIGSATGGSISPDRQRVVVSTTQSVSVHTFPGTQQVETWQTRHNSKVLALDGGVQVYACWDKQPGDKGFSAIGYLGDDPDEPSATGTVKFHEARALARTANGFAALTLGNHDTLHLHLITGSGWRFHDYGRRTVELCAAIGIPAKHARAQWAMTTDPGSGLIAFAGDQVYLARLTGDGLDLLGTAPFRAGPVPRLAFSGPDRLIGMDDDRMLRVWRVDDDGPHMLAERKLAASSPVDLPGAGMLVVTDLSSNTGRSLRFLDRDTLSDVPAPPGYDGRGDPSTLFTSDDGDWLGVCFRDFVELFEVRLSTLATRPLAATTPADLHAVQARLGREPAARSFLELLSACLEHRFGADVALGDGDPLAVLTDDIALGEVE
jgi:hypothetical protein